jgi:hypothetical protein
MEFARRESDPADVIVYKVYDIAYMCSYKAIHSMNKEN